jgi:hypothetical protein
MQIEVKIMRGLNCTDIYRYTLAGCILLVLPATSVFALKPPGNAVPQPAPLPSEPSKVTSDKPPRAVEPRVTPSGSSSQERVQADSAVSFPVDI